MHIENDHKEFVLSTSEVLFLNSLLRREYYRLVDLKELYSSAGFPSVFDTYKAELEICEDLYQSFHV